MWRSEIGLELRERRWEKNSNNAVEISLSVYLSRKFYSFTDKIFVVYSDNSTYGIFPVWTEYGNHVGQMIPVSSSRHVRVILNFSAT